VSRRVHIAVFRGTRRERSEQAQGPAQQGGAPDGSAGRGGAQPREEG
jgi:hypothetical protein